MLGNIIRDYYHFIKSGIYVFVEYKYNMNIDI